MYFRLYVNNPKNIDKENAKNSDSICISSAEVVNINSKNTNNSAKENITDVCDSLLSFKLLYKILSGIIKISSKEKTPITP